VIVGAIIIVAYEVGYEIPVWGLGIGGEGMASPKERRGIREGPFDGLRVDILRGMSKALASHGESIAKVNSIDK
jgi:hypothetical protein